MLRALVLDLDGTILDTEWALYEAWKEVYRRRGVTLPRREWLRSVGSSPDLFDPYRCLEELVGRPLDRGAVMAEAEREAGERLAVLRPLPGVVELVREARRRGLLMAVASSSPRQWVDTYLEQAGVADAIPVRVTADDVERVKPAPDLYLLAVRALGIRASEALAIEDSPHGARAALDAGLRCIVVPSELTRDQPLPDGAVRLDSLEGWSPEALWALACRAGERATGVG